MVGGSVASSEVLVKWGDLSFPFCPTLHDKSPAAEMTPSLPPLQIHLPNYQSSLLCGYNSPRLCSPPRQPPSRQHILLGQEDRWSWFLLQDAAIHFYKDRLLLRQKNTVK